MTVLYLFPFGDIPDICYVHTQQAPQILMKPIQNFCASKMLPHIAFLQLLAHRFLRWEVACRIGPVVCGVLTGPLTIFLLLEKAHQSAG